MRNPFLSFCLILLAALAASAQEPTRKSADPELDKIETLIRDAWHEFDRFTGGGGKPGDPNNPMGKWAATLWQYRDQHPGTAAAARATSESVHFLIHADQVKEAFARADTVSLDDAAWKSLIGVVLEGASLKGDYDFLISKALSLLDGSKDAEVKVRAQFDLAQAHWKKEDSNRARAAFEKVIADYPDTPYAKEAEGNIYEIDLLNIGQPAPLFATKSTSGQPLSISEFRGKVVLLYFWASW
jgi:hypothetical protein